MTKMDVLNEELKRLHLMYEVALRKETSGIRVAGEGYHVPIWRQIQILTETLLKLPETKCED